MNVENNLETIEQILDAVSLLESKLNNVISMITLSERGVLIKKGNEADKDFVRRITWDSSDFQGRSYDKVQRDEKIVMYTFMILTASLFLFALYSVLVNVFKISFF